MVIKVISNHFKSFYVIVGHLESFKVNLSHLKLSMSRTRPIGIGLVFLKTGPNQL